jgi:hypothetical protein
LGISYNLEASPSPRAGRFFHLPNICLFGRSNDRFAGDHFLKTIAICALSSLIETAFLVAIRANTMKVPYLEPIFWHW